MTYDKYELSVNSSYTAYSRAFRSLLNKSPDRIVMKYFDIIEKLMKNVLYWNEDVGRLVEMLENPSQELQYHLVKNNVDFFVDIKNVTDETIKYVLKKEPEQILAMSKPSDEIRKFAIRELASSFNGFDNPIRMNVKTNIQRELFSEQPWSIIYFMKPLADLQEKFVGVEYKLMKYINYPSSRMIKKLLKEDINNMRYLDLYRATKNNGITSSIMKHLNKYFDVKKDIEYKDYLNKVKKDKRVKASARNKIENILRIHYGISYYDWVYDYDDLRID